MHKIAVVWMWERGREEERNTHPWATEIQSTVPTYTVTGNNACSKVWLCNSLCYITVELLSKIHKLEVSTSRVVQPVPVNLLSQHTESYYCMYSTRTKCRVSQVIQPSHGPPGTLLVSNLQCIAPTYSHRVLLVLNQSHLFPVLQKCRVVAKRWRTEGWLLDYTTGTLM